MMIKGGSGHKSKFRSSDGGMSSSMPDGIAIEKQQQSSSSGRNRFAVSTTGGTLTKSLSTRNNNAVVRPPTLRRNVSDSEVDELALMGGSSHHNSKCVTLKVCKQCAKKPLRLTAKDLQAMAMPLIMPQADIGDNGLLELIHSIRNQKLYGDNRPGNEPSVQLEQADDIVARATEKIQEFDQQRATNIQQYAPNDRRIYQENLDAIGKFEWDELQIGSLLGVGGFSNVSEIWGFQCKDNKDKDKDNKSSSPSKSSSNNKQSTSSSSSSSSYTRKELVARKFLTKHAIRTTPTPAQQNNQLTSSIHSSTRSAATTATDSLRSIGTMGQSSRSIMSSSTASSTNDGGKSSSSKNKPSYRYAVKHLRPRLSDIYDKRTFHCAAVDLIMEAHFLLGIQHPNIIKLRGYASAGPNGYKETASHNGYFLILDQLPETMEQRLVFWRKRVKKYKSIKRSLVSKVLLKKNRETASRKLDELLEDRYIVASEICDAMAYLHARRMINRDLKIANIGFDVRGDVKLFDFGLSRWLPTSLLVGAKATPQALLDETFHMSSVGTKLYMAPEVMLREPYSTKADVYSFGIVLWEMLCLQDPTWNREPSDAKDVKAFAKQALESIPLCPCWPEPIHQILKRCISPDPNDRPNFVDIRKMFLEELLMLEDDDDDDDDDDEYCVGAKTFTTTTTTTTAGGGGGGGGPRKRTSLASKKSGGGNEFGGDDDIKYASDVDLSPRARQSLHSATAAAAANGGGGAVALYAAGCETDDDDDNQCDDVDNDHDDEEETRDALGDLSATDLIGAPPAARRRSTHVLNFNDLSWMSSGSLRYAMDGSMKDNSIKDNNNSNNNSSVMEGVR